MKRQQIEFGDQRVSCANAAESTIGILECPKCGMAHARIYIAMQMDRTDPAVRAMYGTYTPAQAREIAAEFLAWANQIDGGGAKH